MDFAELLGRHDLRRSHGLPEGTHGQDAGQRRVSDFYEWGDGDIPAVSSAVWQLYVKDEKMVQITEQPWKYLTLNKHVNKGKFVETMETDGWTHVEGYFFERNSQIVQIDIETKTRDIAIIQVHMKQ